METKKFLSNPNFPNEVYNISKTVYVSYIPKEKTIKPEVDHDETVLVIIGPEVFDTFLVLKGDFREQYSQFTTERECINFFEDNKEEYANEYSKDVEAYETRIMQVVKDIPAL